MSAKFYFSASCDIHGTLHKDKGDCRKFVTVGAPKGKKQRREGGCPICKALEREAK